MERIITTPQGDVAGVQRDGHEAFLGGRFAAPLGPENRYRPASPVLAHKGV